MIKRKFFIWLLGLLILITIIIAIVRLISITTITPSVWSETVKFFGEDVEIMPVKYIKPGMTGYGKTVFEGTVIEKFRIKVVNVTEEMKNTHLIWIRPTQSPKDILKRAGIIAGMSGSSTYLLLEDEKTGQEKLAGALAYGFGYQPFTEAIAGITPIEEMLRLQELREIYQQNENFAQESEEGFTARLDKLRIPIIFSGCDPRIIKFFKEELIGRTGFKVENFNFIELNAGGQTSLANTNTTITNTLPLKNGDAIAGVLSKGAVTLTGIGTVTLSNKKGFIAFGHPFFWTGKTDIPVFGAEIAMVVPSMESSFKYPKAIIGPQLGTIEVDSLEGVLGVWHSKNTMLPTKTTITKSYLGGSEKKEEFNTDIAPKMFISDYIFFFVVANSVFVAAPDLENVNVELETKFTYLDKNGIEQEAVFPKRFFAKDWKDIFYGLTGIYGQYKMFSKAKVELVKIDTDIKIVQERTEIPTLYLSRVEPEKRQVKPNEKMLLGLMLNDKKKYYSQTLEIQAPDFQGEMKISIQDRSSRLQYLVYEAIEEPSKINRVLEFAKISVNKENVFYVELQYIQSIAERKGINNRGWEETIKKTDELVNTEIKEVKLPEIAGKFNLNISAQLTIRVTNMDIKEGNF